MLIDYQHIIRLILLMKSKTIDEDQSGREMNLMFKTLTNKIKQLDCLTHTFKKKQEHKFLSTFTHVVTRMGQDLSSAKEELCHFDQELRKDDYCLQLAEKNNFFRTQCISMQEEIILLKQQLQNKNNALNQKQEELKITKIGLANKIKECMKLSQENCNLKRKLKDKQISIILSPQSPTKSFISRPSVQSSPGEARLRIKKTSLHPKLP